MTSRLETGYKVDVAQIPFLSKGNILPRLRTLNGFPVLDDHLEPMGISQYRIAHDISVPPRRINEIVHGTRAVTADTALHLARYVGTTDRFWINLQSGFDLEHQKDILGDRLEKEVIVFAKAS